jgi:regulatory protein
LLDVVAEQPTVASVKKSGLNLLARREHSQVELRNKLQLRSFPLTLIETALQELSREGWQSDSRFAECYTQMRINRGFGPLRIRYELQQRGIHDELIEACLPSDNEFWLEKIALLCRKKFATKVKNDIKGRAKQQRFLQQRGFTFEQIRCHENHSNKTSIYRIL